MIAHLNLTFKDFYILASSIISKFTFLFPFLNSYPKIVTDTSAILHDVLIHYSIPLPARMLKHTNTHKQDHFQLPSFPLWTFWALLWAIHLKFNYTSSYIFTLVQSLLLLGKFWRLILPVINWFVIWSWGEVFYAYELKEKQSREWLMKKYKNCHFGKSRTARRKNKQK